MKKNVLEYLEDGSLRHFISKPAIIDGAKEITFGDLVALAKAAAWLIQTRVPKLQNQPIAIFLPKSIDGFVAILAVLYSGNFYVPLDVQSPPLRLKKLFENLGPTVVLTLPPFKPILLQAGVKEDRILYLSDASPITPKNMLALQARWERIVDTDPAYIIYTSGSTGTPKGVVIAHRGIIDYIDWALGCFQINESSVIGSQSPFYFDNSTLDIYLCLSTRAKLVIIPDQLFGFPVRLIQYLKEKEINFIFWVPSVLVNVANQKALDYTQLPELRHILFAGEVMPARHLNYWRQRFPKSTFANLYGPTEITVDCTYYILNREISDYESIPIGFPCRNTDVLILNDRNRPAQVGEPGELCVRGSSLALGYWNNPEQTAKAFTQNPLNTCYPEIIYRTGDLVSRNESGEIMFIGRKDYQIKHLGYRIELAEIETAMLAITEIQKACVLYHHQKKEITLFFESNVKLSARDIRQKLTDRLPKYMFPTAFHQLDALPCNPNGKIDRQILTEAYLRRHEVGLADRPGLVPVQGARG